MPVFRYQLKQANSAGRKVNTLREQKRRNGGNGVSAYTNEAFNGRKYASSTLAYRAVSTKGRNTPS